MGHLEAAMPHDCGEEIDCSAERSEGFGDLERRKRKSLFLSPQTEFMNQITGALKSVGYSE
jgi:hypothetical protein